MKKLLSLVPLAGLACLLAAQASNAHHHDEPGAPIVLAEAASDAAPADEEPGEKAAESVNPSTANIPEPMIWRRPDPDSSVCLPYTIDVRFVLNEHMMFGERHNPEAFTLWVDGKDVRRDLTFFPNQQVPETHVAVLHAMYVYKPGEHSAKIQWPDADGEKATYEWKFSVGSDCKKPVQ